ncbi:trypsin 3A1 [Scaptodrosophila lebanonensis]|uniref:Trypsin 3A1 n=1 Tax=Drosophila lebanonensis TaxID=7225 RepID=A0A6J2UHM4_DROLE|nr:trypsin 3A1 [Scaptodrosophila lebanonensis]
MYSIQLFVVALLLLIQQQLSSGAALNTTAGAIRNKDGRIVGGSEASISYFPHQVSIQMGTRHACGGSILTNRIILTAAHCVREYSKPQLYFVRAGSDEWARGGSFVGVRRIIPHAQFEEPTRLNHDIALLLLQQPLVYSPSIQPIALVSPMDFVHPQMPLYITGWGTTGTSLITETRLRYTSIFQVDHAECQATYMDVGVVTDTMICAGVPFGGRDSCQGDSGGPLITNIGHRWKLLGIVSWGIGCGQAQYPGIYTRVTAYNDWVAQTMKLLQ